MLTSAAGYVGSSAGAAYRHLTDTKKSGTSDTRYTQKKAGGGASDALAGVAVVPEHGRAT
jgi:hypothetical protein